jgi:NADPH2:quinone reductase
MPQAIRIHATGGPEVLQWEDVSVADPGPGEVRLRHTAVGLNFIDVYHRIGLYPLPLPVTPGLEGAGEVVAVGPGVEDLLPGDRVAYAGGPPGAYATERLIPAHRLVHLPDTIGDRQAAAMMLQGLTAQYLLRRTCRVEAGDAILFHAAAGGVGLIACQWAKHLGATVGQLAQNVGYSAAFLVPVCAAAALFLLGAAAAVVLQRRTKTTTVAA